MRTKKNYTISGLFVAFLFTVMLTIWWSCKTEKVGPTEPISISYKPNVASKIFDLSTNQPISNAKVTFDNKTVNTNNMGEFIIETSLEPGQHVLIAEADDYVFTPILVSITSEATILNSIFMKKKGTSITINSQQSTITDKIGDSRFFEVQIPDGCFSQETKITITPLEGPEAGSFFDENIPIAILDIQAIPDNKPERQFRILFPLPCKLVPGIELLLTKSTKIKPVNELSVFVPVVQEDSLTAIVEVNEFGRYTLSLNSEYTFKEEILKNTLIDSLVTDSKKVFSIERPANSVKVSNLSLQPPDLLEEYCISLLERNYGFKFDYPTVITFCLNSTTRTSSLPKIHNANCFGSSNHEIIHVLLKCPSGQENAPTGEIKTKYYDVETGQEIEISAEYAAIGGKIKYKGKLITLGSVTHVYYKCVHDQGGGSWWW
ncbi:MAG: carboxypeptidase-like regulatory domain-containing protein [Ignavibacteria bacterium]|jgi:hypothetical protein